MSGAAVKAADPGVTDKTVKIGYIYPATGVAASISQNGVKAFQARIDAQNAAGGVNGRKIEVVAKDDGSSGQNVQVTHDLVENENVFAVVDQSPFAFLSYRYLLDNGVPMVGNGVDGTYYQQKGNEAILSSGGNGNPFGDLTYDGPARIMKQAGADKIGVLAYGAASSSVARRQGPDAVRRTGGGSRPRVHEHVDRLRRRRRRCAGARAQERRRQRRVPAHGGRHQHRGGAGPPAERGADEGGADGHRLRPGPARLARRQVAPRHHDLPGQQQAGRAQGRRDQEVPGQPEEVRRHHRCARLRHVHRLHPRRLHDRGDEEGGQEPDPPGASSTVATASASTTRPGWPASRSTSASAASVEFPTTTCGWALKLVDDKFQLFPKSGKPFEQKLVGSAEALAANKEGLAATPTTVPATTAAPAS